MKILSILLLLLSFSVSVYAACDSPDCFCITDKCERQRAYLQQKEKADEAKQEIMEAEVEIEEVKHGCYYMLPFSKTKIYFFKMSTSSECGELFQVGYVDSSKLSAVVMKDEFESNMEIFHRPSFENRENLVEYINQNWKDAKLIHHKSLKELK